MVFLQTCCRSRSTRSPRSASRTSPQPLPTVRRGALPASRTAAATTSLDWSVPLRSAEPILAALGFGANRVATIETDDPDMLGGTLRSIPAMQPAPRPARFPAHRCETRRAAVRADANCTGPLRSRLMSCRCPARAPFGSVRGERRRLHAVPFVCVGLPDRRADRRSGAAHCCALPRMPACSAGCARQPVPRRSSP